MATVTLYLRGKLAPILDAGRPRAGSTPDLSHAQITFDASQAWHDMYGELMERAASLHQASRYLQTQEGRDEARIIAGAFEQLAEELERRA